MLRCITSYFNVNNSQRVKDNFIKFRQNFNAPLTVVELAFDDQPFWIDDAIQIRGNSSNLMWQKERLLNIALASLPPKVDQVAWIDADVIFQNKNWFKLAQDKLDRFPIIQLFSNVYETNTNNDPVNTGEGYVYKKYKNKQYDLSEIPYNKKIDCGKFGLAWAANLSEIPEGLHDFSIVGASDIHQVIAWEGAWDNYHINLMPDKYRKEIISQSMSMFLRIKGNLSFIPGHIEHLQHGTLSNRNYEGNQVILRDYDFSIEEDIHIDINNLWQWKSDKPDLQKAVADIFYTRHEDQ